MYYNTQTHTFGHSHNEVAQALNASFSIGTLQVGDYYFYKPAAQPSFDPNTERIEQSDRITQREGIYWLREWDVIALTPEEIQTKKEQQQEQVWDQIKRERDRRSDEGGTKVGTNWFHSDPRSKTQQMGLVMMGAGIPSGLMWKTMDGSFVEMTPTLAQQIFGAAAANEQALFAVAEGHRTAMLAVPNPASYDFTTGWPQAFWEVTT